MRSNLTRRLALVAAASAAVAGLASLTSAAATASLAAGPNSLISSTGQITPAPTGILSAVHDGHLPTSAPTLAHPNSVIGTDERTQVNPTTTFPARAVVQIKYNGGQGCTGWMISANYLLTAGHCVYNTTTKAWATGMTFTPGANGASAPYGTCGLSAYWSFTAYVNSGDSNYDIGIVRLDCSIGNTVGWFGTWWQTASLNGAVETVEGYPCDKPVGTQWRSTGTIVNSSADRLSYANDTAPCQSGSPIWQYRWAGSAGCTGYCGMGVHTNGAYAGTNSGVRFTKGKLDAVYALVNQG